VQRGQVVRGTRSAGIAVAVEAVKRFRKTHRKRKEFTAIAICIQVIRVLICVKGLDECKVHCEENTH